MSLAHFYLVLIQHLLNLCKLLMFVFVLPTNERQHIETIRTLWQTVPPYSAGMVVVTPVGAVRCIAYLALPATNNGPFIVCTYFLMCQVSLHTNGLPQCTHSSNSHSKITRSASG